MIALKTIDMRKDFKSVGDIVYAGERVLISRPHNQNLIVLSEHDFNELERLARNAAYLEKLDHSYNQIQEGKIITMPFEQLEAMEE